VLFLWLIFDPVLSLSLSFGRNKNVVLLRTKKAEAEAKSYEMFRFVHKDWSLTTIHIARYDTKMYVPRHKLFDREVRLLD
jgi:hypothetical protein